MKVNSLRSPTEVIFRGCGLRGLCSTKLTIVHKLMSLHPSALRELCMVFGITQGVACQLKAGAPFMRSRDISIVLTARIRAHFWPYIAPFMHSHRGVS